jgi:4-amino-4-deoxy-L-arabinose transferase-like glycosyltransferase
VAGRRVSHLTFLAVFAALLGALHLPYLRLPFHWDELGQFVPAALDLYREGGWIPHSTEPNVHPPGVMAILAAVWSVTGYSILSARVAMLAIAALGVYFSFLLAIRLGRGSEGAPAFAAVLFLIASPLFYTQSMMVLLDMPAMTLTVLAMLLFLRERYRWCAVASTVLVLVKETGIAVPLVLGAWLWLRERRRDAVWFAVPMTALAAWLFTLHRATGHWLGSTAFAQDNVASALTPLHIAAAALRNAWALFGADGRWLGSLALFLGRRALRGRDWSAVLWVCGVHALMVTLFGGAVLERYLLPAMPVVFAAMAVAASTYPARWRLASHTAMIALLIAGWFWNPPYPTQFENNLAMVNFVRLQQDAAGYLEAYEPGSRVASAWPFTDAIRRPEFGYVAAPFRALDLRGLDWAAIQEASEATYDAVVVYSRSPSGGGPRFLWRYTGYQPEATEEELRAALGLKLRMRSARGGQHIAIYARE